MLKLHQVELSGFKSFVDPVTLTFAGGITAIVGPNGCGKSNISDGITWVLGEQSAKSLRGSSMQDVIFNGTDTRKPVGMAEVNLTLETDPSFEHAIDGKVQIGRRVFRGGQSEYRLNGKVSRLKQIKDILMDTGLGIRAYSVIEQGKIGMILSGKPQERRRLLEEAAGITRYKARKRIAEVKLEEATANLLRLDDIISEIERTLRSLKRQANAARRYQERETEYRALLRDLLLGRWVLLRGAMDGLAVQLNVLIDRDAELAAHLARDEAALVSGREELDQLAAVLAERHQEQADLGATIEGRQEFLKGARERRSEVEERLHRGHAEAEARQRQSGELESALGHFDERSRELIAERDAAARRVAEDDERIAAAESAVRESEARLESLRRSLLGSLSQVNQLRSQLQHEQVEIEKRAFRQRYLDDERQRLDHQVGEAETTVVGIDEQIEMGQRRLAEFQTQRDRLTEELDRLLGREAEASDESRELETERLGLVERRRLLRQLGEEHAEKRQSLVARLAELGVAEPRFLADVIRPVEGFEDGIDHFLGELTEAVLVSSNRDGLELARALSSSNSAGIFLRPLEGGAEPPPVSDPAARRPLGEALGLPPGLARALPPAHLVDRAEDAARLAAEHPGVAFLSRDRMWAQGGTLRVQGEAAAPGLLARESELEAIDGRLPEIEARLEELGTWLEQLVEERARTATTSNRLDDEIAELRREIAVAQARRQDAVGRQERLRAEQATVVEEQDEIRQDLVKKGEQRALLKRRLEETEATHEASTGEFDRTQQETEEARARREAVRTEGAGRRGRLELLEERMESQHQQALRVRRQIDETERQLTAWAEEREALERRRDELDEAMERAEAELQSALEHRATAQEGVLAQQELLDERRDAMRELEGQVHETRTGRESLRDEIENLRVSQAGQRQDAEHLGATFREEFKALLPGLPSPPTADAGSEPSAGTEVKDASTGNDDSAENPEAEETETRVEGETVAGETAEDDSPEAAASNETDGNETDSDHASPSVLTEISEDELPEIDRGRLAELEADLARCKATLERLGPVNVLAAQEYDDELEREKFLKTQRRDVAESVASLRETIREINEASTERFAATFEMVNRTFGETFTKLFRGGEAEMRLLDEDDILETGIEIVARPPGKRPQNIMLLSGGEKALTAIALLFALFQSRPSPFCILDEVDAPLDDVNVLRFVELLREMAQDTQFLVVTHNKLTMEAASTLYGVTMEERGSSKLVSVELEDVHPELENAA